MDYNRIFESSGKTFYVVGLEAAGLMSLRRELAERFPATTIRVIRGDKSTGEEAFFNEAGAALQFPENFVELWENFEVLLNDLSWLPSGEILLLVSFAPFLLCDEEPAVFGELVEQLYRAAQNRRVASLKILFQTAPDDLPAFQDRLEESGADYTLITS